MTSEFEATVRRCDGSAVVDFRGELDLASASSALEQIASVAQDGGSVVVDLSAVTFIDSSGLGVLLRARQLLPPSVSLRLRAPQPQAKRLFESAGVDEILTIES